MEPLIEQSLRTIQKGSKSFALAARLFDPATREGAILLYAWCRHCDDVTDEQVLGSRAGRRATRLTPVSPPWNERRFAPWPERRSTSRPSRPLRSCAGTASRSGTLDHLKGFAMDVEGVRYETLDDCCRYCYHVAGVVGVMMAYVMGARGEDTLDRASDLGLGFPDDQCRPRRDGRRRGRPCLSSRG